MNAAQIAALISEGQERRLDSRETALLARQLEHIKSRTYDTKYSALKARRFVPVSNEANPATETIVYRQWDQYGMAKIVGNYADDVPMVDVVAVEVQTPVKSLANGYSYSFMDLRRAAMSQQPLDVQRANAARRAIESALDDVASKGIPQAGIKGLVNHPNVPIVTPITGSWTSATSAALILADLNKLVNSIVIVTGEIHAPNTLLLDNASFALIASMPAGDNLDKTVLRVFLDTNPYITAIDQWSKLNTASASGGKRIMAYLRDPEILELEIPQEFEQLPPERAGMIFKVICHLRTGGVVIRYPLALAYMDGI